MPRTSLVVLLYLCGGSKSQRKKIIFKRLKNIEKAVVVVAIFGCIFSLLLLLLNICHIYLSLIYTNPPTVVITSRAEQQYES